MNLISGMICEPSHFKQANSREAIEKHVGPCGGLSIQEDIYFPAYQPTNKNCIVQKQAMLYSCVGEHAEYARVCPCRGFMKGQTALCDKCLW